MPTPKGWTLIQRNFSQSAKNGPTRNKLAFDKCTLLSSQGTDAPTETISRPTREATSLPYTTPNPTSHSGTHQGINVVEAGRRPEPKLYTIGASFGIRSPLERTRGLSAAPLSPVGRTSNNLRGSRRPVQSTAHPGRVAPPKPRKNAELRCSELRRRRGLSGGHIRTGIHGSKAAASTAPPVN